MSEYFVVKVELYVLSVESSCQENLQELRPEHQMQLYLCEEKVNSGESWGDLSTTLDGIHLCKALDLLRARILGDLLKRERLCRHEWEQVLHCEVLIAVFDDYALQKRAL